MQVQKSSFQGIKFFAIPVVYYSIFLFSSCHSSNRDEQQHAYASLSDSATYVGINVCKQCHQAIYETFIQTGMGKSFDTVSRSKSSAVFDESAVIYDKYRNFYYHPFWKNDSLFLYEFRLEGADTVYRRTEKINFIVGSGQHTNSHLTMVHPSHDEHGGYVYQVPATYYTQKGTWDLPPGFENGYNNRFSRKIELECMTCHNAYPNMIAGSENKFESVPNGIDCERCHGPGSAHVKQIQAGILVDTAKRIDYSIVNPAKLPVALQMDICQRCHIQGNAVLNDGKSFFDFRPGMLLSDVMNVFMPVFKGDENTHIMASHVERLKMSRCFIAGMQKSGKEKTKDNLRPFKNALTCLTCHNPHVSVRVTGNEVFTRACKNCHHDHAAGNDKDEKILLCSETMEKRMLLNDNCVTCHMPKNNTIDIPHVTSTDHFIRKPAMKDEVKKIKEFLGLACINNQNPPRKAVAGAYLSYYEKFSSLPAVLDSAKYYLDDGTSEELKRNFNDLVRWAFLKNDPALVIRYAERAGDVFSFLNRKNFSNEDAWTAYRIGESFYSKDSVELAISYFRRAVDLESFNLEFRNKLASAEMDLGWNDEAGKNFLFILNENPKFVSAWTNIGYLILTADHNLAKADSCYSKALELDPDNEQALMNKTGILFIQHRKKDSEKMLRKILKRYPANEKARALLHSLERN